MPPFETGCKQQAAHVCGYVQAHKKIETGLKRKKNSDIWDPLDRNY
jgi:hypothetical protein